MQKLEPASWQRDILKQTPELKGQVLMSSRLALLWLHALYICQHYLYQIPEFRVLETTTLEALK